jgi:DNA primase catalytic core
VIEELTPHLIDYLREQNVHVDGLTNFNCINKEHDDSNPSMGVVPGSNGHIVHCFGCGASYNIFHAAHHLEDKAIRGERFLTETVPYLAGRYGIEFNIEDLELSPEQLEIMRYRSLYEDAAAVLREIGTHTHAAERGWTETTCREMDIGTVEWPAFEDRLRNKGTYTPEELRTKGINAKLFGARLITHTIRDHQGRVSGFVARAVDFRPEDKSTGPKFRNTSDSVPIYSKRRLLYGLNIAGKERDGKLDILEGYGDLVTAQQAGHRRCVALGGVALTEEHVDIVRKIGFDHVNIILDADSTGRERMRRYLERFSGRDGLKVTATILPFEPTYPENQRDPDNFIKEHGLQQFLSVEPMTSFDWMLRDLQEQQVNGREIVDKLIPHIISEPNVVERGRMCKNLADISEVKEDDIRGEVKRRVNSQVKDISENLQRKLHRAGDAVDIRMAIASANEAIESTNQETDRGVLHNNRVMDHLESFRFNSLNPSTELPGWKTGIPSLDDPLVLGGIPKEESILSLGGPPNHGKSAIMNNILKGTLLHEKENKGMTNAFWSLDDSLNVFWAKMLASVSRIPILDIKRPDRRILSNPELKASYDGWYEWLREQVRKGKLLAKSHDIGNTLVAAEDWVKYIQDTTGNQVVLYIDAVHDMSTGNEKQDTDERTKFIRVYEWFQRATEQLGFTVVTCAHITKAGMAKGRPSQTDISETGKALFSSKFIGMVYSELDYFSSENNRDQASMYWIDDRSESIDNRKPVVELNITKSKETSFKGMIYLKHDNDCCYMEEVDTARMAGLKKRNLDAKPMVQDTGPVNTEQFKEYQDSHVNTETGEILDILPTN